VPEPLKALEMLQRRGRKDENTLADSVFNEGINAFVKKIESLARDLHVLSATVDKNSTTVAKVLTGSLTKKQVDGSLNQLLSTIVNSMPQTDLRPVLSEMAELTNNMQAIAQSISSIPKTDLTDVLLSQGMVAKQISDIEFPQIPEQRDFSSILNDILSRLDELEKPKNFEFQIERFTSNPNSNIKSITARQVK
jgi:hypothetical protein